MKYIRILIGILLLILIGVGGYYIYLIVKTPRVDNLVGTEESETTFELPKNTQAPSPTPTNFTVYTTAKLSSQEEEIKIEGRFQAADKLQNSIDGVLYSYVIGINDDKGNFYKIWLTQEEGLMLDGNVFDGILSGRPVSVVLSKNSISFKPIPF